MGITDRQLWIFRVGDRIWTTLDLPTDISAVVLEPSSHTFYVDNHHLKVIFRAKSKHEMNEWVETINNRSILSSENDVIAMADEYMSRAESRASNRDIQMIADGASFEGVLHNRYRGWR